MAGRIPPNKPTTNLPASGGAVALYGVFMQDHLGGLRSDISSSISDIQAGLKTLSPDDQKSANKALTQMNKALGKLQFVSPLNWGKSTATSKAAIGPASGGANALYGVFVNTKLTAYKNEISSTISEINRGIKTKQFSGDEVKEATAAKTALTKALADLK